MKQIISIPILALLLLMPCANVHAEWDWEKDSSLMLWLCADSGITSIDGVKKWRDKSSNNNHMTMVGTPEVKENSINNHRAMRLSSAENEYFYVDFDEYYVGSSTIFIVANPISFSEYKSFFSTNTPNRMKQHNTFETYLLNNNIEGASMNSASRDINKDRQFNNVGFEFNKYKNFISRYEVVENSNGEWAATKLKTMYGVYSPEEDKTTLQVTADFSNRASSSEARFNTYAGFSVGSRWDFKNNTPDAEYAEVIIFKKALSDSEILQVSNYLSEKYFKSASQDSAQSFKFGANTWLCADAYPQDIDFDGLLEIEDRTENNNFLKETQRGSAPKYKEKTMNGYGSYLFTEESHLNGAWDNYTEKGCTIMLAADISRNGKSGEIFSTGTGGASLYKTAENKLALKSGDDMEIIGDIADGLNFYSVKTDAAKKIVQVCSNKKSLMLKEYVSEWEEHEKLSLGGADFELYEMIVYDRALNDEEQNGAFDYFEKKYLDNLFINKIEYEYTDEDGEPAEVIPEDGTMKASIYLENRYSQNINNARLVCCVKKNKKLISVSLSDEISLQAESSAKADVSVKITNLFDGLEIEYMLWNGKNLKPLREAYKESYKIN